MSSAGVIIYTQSAHLFPKSPAVELFLLYHYWLVCMFEAATCIFCTSVTCLYCINMCVVL